MLKQKKGLARTSCTVGRCRVIAVYLLYLQQALKEADCLVQLRAIFSYVRASSPLGSNVPQSQSCHCRKTGNSTYASSHRYTNSPDNVAVHAMCWTGTFELCICPSKRKRSKTQVRAEFPQLGEVEEMLVVVYRRISYQNGSYTLVARRTGISGARYSYSVVVTRLSHTSPSSEVLVECVVPTPTTGLQLTLLFSAPALANSRPRSPLIIT